MDNQILEMLAANQSNQMHIDVLDLHSSEMSSWFLSEYKIRADDRKMKIYGKDKDLSYHWIEFIQDENLFSHIRQDDIFDIIKCLQFTYKERYNVGIKIQTIKRKQKSLVKLLLSHKLKILTKQIINNKKDFLNLPCWQHDRKSNLIFRIV